MNTSNRPTPDTSRRQFLSSFALAGAAVAMNSPFVLTARAAADDPIRIALIGCGGRGRGAANDAINAAPNVQLVALADLFPEQVEAAHKIFNDVPKENCFSGFDACVNVLKVPGVNYAIIASPPGFRPAQFAAAIEAGKHVFMEKPVAVDAPGIRRVLAAGERATEKKLCVVAGTQRRHQPSYLETIQRIHAGAIGEVLCLRAYWNQGAIWHRGYDRNRSEMENQIRNWYHYTWLSGDHIVEQHVHNLDVCNWVMNDHPVKAYGQGGRQTLGDKSGHIWDHFAVEFEYKNGVRMFSQSRQISSTDGNVGEAAVGTKGTSDCANYIRPKAGSLSRYPYGGSKQAVNPYVQEHADLIQAIRNGELVNETQTVAFSTMTAIMGRESAYSGRVIAWDEALKWETSLMPAKLEWGPAPVPAAPMPGKHEMI